MRRVNVKATTDAKLYEIWVKMAAAFAFLV